jgi:tetratricopeptide (TPR) repeat protein
MNHRIDVLTGRNEALLTGLLVFVVLWFARAGEAFGQAKAADSPDMIVTDILFDDTYIYTKYMNAGAAGTGEFTIQYATKERNSSASGSYKIPEPGQEHISNGTILDQFGLKPGATATLSVEFVWVKKPTENNIVYKKQITAPESAGDDSGQAQKKKSPFAPSPTSSATRPGKAPSPAPKIPVAMRSLLDKKIADVESNHGGVPAEQEAVVAEIKKAGGLVSVDGGSPGKPVLKIDLMNAKFTDAGLERLKVLTQLERLDLSGTQITDAGLTHLTALTQLQTLNLSKTQITDAGLEHLKKMPQLRNLQVGDTKITDDGLACFAEMPQLRMLSLVATKVTDDGLEHLEGLAQLQNLALNFSLVTDDGMVHLKGLTQLQVLSMNRIQVTDDGLEYLKGLTKLQNLTFDGAKITDAGLEHLKGLAKLQSLDLGNSKASAEGIAKLKQALPNSTITVNPFPASSATKPAIATAPPAPKSSVAANSPPSKRVADVDFNPGGKSAVNAIFPAGDSQQQWAQTFTIGATGVLTEIDVFVKHFVPTRGSLVMELRRADAEGIPTTNGGGVLCSASADAKSVPQGDDGFVAFDIASRNIRVISGEKYAVALHAGDNASTFKWLGLTGDPYSGGKAFDRRTPDADWADDVGCDLGIRTFVMAQTVSEAIKPSPTEGNESLRKTADGVESSSNKEGAADSRFTSESGTIEFERLLLSIGPKYDSSRNVKDFGGWLPAGQDMDVVWQLPCKVYVMKEKGRLKPIWELADADKSAAQITGVCFDGQFIWVCVRMDHAKPRLFVLDYKRESSLEVGEEDGLPVGGWTDTNNERYKSKLLVQKIEPGKVLLVAWAGRTIVGTVTYDGGKSIKVKTFYKSLENTASAGSRSAASAKSNPSASQSGVPAQYSQAIALNGPPTEFIPSYIMDFHGKDNAGKPARRLIVGSKSYGDDRPLVVDPDKEKVGVASETWYQISNPNYLPAIADDSFYRVESRGNSLQLVKFGLPDFRRVVLLSDVPEGWCVQYDKRFLVVGGKWWLIDPTAAKAEDRVLDLDTERSWTFSPSSKPGKEYPGDASAESEKRENFELTGFIHSSHYGLLAARKRKGGTNSEFLRVTLNPRAIEERRLSVPILAAKKKESLESEIRAGTLVLPYVHFDRLQFTMEPGYEPKAEIPDLGGCIPVEPGLDVFWRTSCNVYAMKEKGRLKPIWDLDSVGGARPKINSITYDGRYVWVAITPMPSLKSYLYVIDPRKEKTWELGEKDGLPKLDGNSQVWVEKIEPGKAMVIAWFDKTAMNAVAFDPDGGAKVNTVFESTKTFSGTPNGAAGKSLPINKDWSGNVQAAFAPKYTLEFHGTTPDGAARRRIVLAGRTSYVTDWPVIVDPDSGNVAIMPEDWNQPSDKCQPFVAGETLYRVEKRESDLHLVRWVSPEFKREVLMQNVPEGWCVQYRDRLFIVGRKWWEIDSKTFSEKNIRVASADLPWTFTNSSSGPNNPFARETFTPSEKSRGYALEAFCPSNFYGLLAIRKKTAAGSNLDVMSVVLDDRAYKLMDPTRKAESTPSNDEIELLVSRGTALFDQENSAEAEPLLTRAWELSQTIKAPDDPSLASLLNILVRVYDAQLKYDKSYEFYPRLLAALEKGEGPKSFMMGISINNFGYMCEKQAKYAEAEAALKRALDIKTKPSPTIDAANTYLNLGAVYRSQGDYDKAEPLYKKSLELREKYLKPNDPDTAVSLRGLALNYAAQGKPEEAEPLMKRALEILEKAFGPTHYRVEFILYDFAEIYREMGRDKDAWDMDDRATKIRRSR